MSLSTKKKANRVYDILVEHAGASESLREHFVYVHVVSEERCNSYRFCGSLGFSGKFYSSYSELRVSCYSEDRTPKRDAIISRVNALLAALS